uniref:hypothetical protein n=1 Tax=Xanthomonas sp. 0924 TaxID=2835534 RepID=UPI003F7DC643
MKLDDSQATQQPSEQEIAQFAAPARAMLAAELDADGQWEAAHAVRVGQAHLHRSATRAIARTLYEVAALKRRLNEQSGNSGQLPRPDAAIGLNEPFGDSEQLQAGATEGLIKRLRKSSAVLLDTSTMATQFPAWLCDELEKAASLHDECATALAARPPVVKNPGIAIIVSGPWPHAKAGGSTRYMVADLIPDCQGPEGQPMFKTRDQVVPAFAAPTAAPVAATTEAMGGGWLLVPSSITDEMTVAFAEAWFAKARPIDDVQMEDCYSALLAARPAPADDWVLVPLEPTAEMLQAAAFGVSGKSGQKFRPMMAAGYAAMLAARPERTA